MGRTYTVNQVSAAVTASGTKTLWLLNPTVTFDLTEIGISFDASAAFAGIGVELYRTTTLGAPAGTAFTPVKADQPADSAATSTTNLTNLTTEPTAVEILRSWFIQPFGGLLVLQFPLGREPQASGTSANRLGLRYIAPATITSNVRSYAEIEE